MKNYLFVTREGDPLPIADRLKDKGKNVVVGIVEDEAATKAPAKEECRLSLYDGILDKYEFDDVLDWLKKMPEAERDEWFVMLDYGDLWPQSEKILALGFTKGIFPTKEGYKLEDDRRAGKAFAKKHYPGVRVAEVHEFKKVEDALFVLDEQRDKIFVLKSEGSNAETVVPMTEDTDLARRQIAGALRSEAKDYEKGGFTLEEKIPNAIEISPVMLFWNGNPLFSLVELENKQLGSGNIGRLSGGCQNLSIQTELNCPLNKIAFPPVIFDMAKKQPGIGLYDAGLLFNGKEFLFTEFCSQRWGWDGIFSEIAMSGGAAHHFDAIAAGASPIRYRYGASVRLFQTEPDPKRPDVFQDGYAMDWMNEVSDQLFFYCIQKRKIEGSDEEQFVSVGYRKDLGVATGSGNTAKEAVDAAYRAADGFAMTGVYYRPMFDFVSKDYFASIWNRLDFLGQSGLLG